MKKTFIASMLLLGILSLSASVAQEALSQELEHLSQAILAKAETPLIQLEHLKLLFLHCGERQEKVALASACQSWLKDSYPKMREALLLKSSGDLQTEGKVLGAKEASPQRIWVALRTGEVVVEELGDAPLAIKKKLGEAQAQSFRLYQVRIPQYAFQYQFLLPLASAAALPDWQRSQSGSIVIPRACRSGLQVAAMFRPYATPQLEEDSSLLEVGKLYKPVFQEVYALKEPQKMYEELFHRGNKWELSALEFLFFLKEQGELPRLITTFPEWTSFSGATDQLYGFLKAPSAFCIDAHLMGVGKAFVWACDPKQATHNPYRWSFWDEKGGLFWNRKGAKYLRAYTEGLHEDLPRMRAGQFIVE